MAHDDTYTCCAFQRHRLVGPTGGGSGAGDNRLVGQDLSGGRGEVTGVLLVGGRSRRFGSPKAFARFGTETLAERAWQLLGTVFDERIAVGKPSEAGGLPFPLVDDGSDVRAPMVGLVAGLRAARTDVIVAIPVDCPLLEADDLRALVASCADAAVPQTGPLPGAYRKSALPVLLRRLAAGQLAIRDALVELDVSVVTLDPDRLANANTPEELAQLLGTTPD